MNQQAADAVLSGIQVLDMTMFLSGPVGTPILGDLGAEAIKIETGSRDQTREVLHDVLGLAPTAIEELIADAIAADGKSVKEGE